MLSFWGEGERGRGVGRLAANDPNSKGPARVCSHRFSHASSLHDLPWSVASSTGEKLLYLFLFFSFSFFLFFFGVGYLQSGLTLPSERLSCVGTCRAVRGSNGGLWSTWTGCLMPWVVCATLWIAWCKELRADRGRFLPFRVSTLET